MCKWNSQTKTSNCGLLEGKLMPNMADPLKFDQIYPHFKHILGNILSKAVLRVRNYLKDDKSVTGEGQKVRVTSRALIYMRTRRARARFRILTAEGMKDLKISFDRHYVRAMGRLGWNTYQTSNFFGSPLRITYVRRARALESLASIPPLRWG